MPGSKKSLTTPILFERSFSSKPHIDILFLLLYTSKWNIFLYKLYKENS